MKRLLTAYLLAATLAIPAAAQTPPEVMKPYKAYIAAFESGDTEKAVELAKKAYEQARKRIPEADVVPVLAENYADLLQYTDPDAALDLYELALAASPESSPEKVERRAELMIKAAKTFLYEETMKRRDVKRADYFFAKTRKFIDEQKLTNTTLGAEIMVLEAWADARLGRRDKALEKLEMADAIFDSPGHTLFSPLEYQGKLIAGSILNRDKKPIKAALVLQDVMQNLEGELAVDHPFIRDAFSKWLFSRSLIADAEITDDALAAGVCKCWPYDEMSENAPIPNLRFPPVMPRNAKRSGQVMLKFDVGRDGKPTNIEPISATETLFINPSVKTIKAWEFDVSENVRPEDLKGIVQTMTFRLADQYGNILEERPLRPISEL